MQARQCLSHEILDKEIRPTLDFLLACRMASGNLPSSLGNGSDRLVQWCHGAAGLVHCLVLASQVRTTIVVPLTVSTVRHSP